jgi:chemotaxis protein histidine kinase CheA
MRSYENLKRLFSVALLTYLPLVCWAQPLDKESLKREAHSALEQGLKAFKSKDLAKGIFHYERAYRLIPDQHTLYTIANAYQRLPNSCQKALQSWERLVMRCQSCDLKSKIKQGYKAVQKQCNVKLSISTPKSGLEVIINQELYGQTPLSVLLPANRYKLELHNGNDVLYKGKIKLAENSRNKKIVFEKGDKGYQIADPSRKSEKIAVALAETPQVEKPKEKSKNQLKEDSKNKAKKAVKAQPKAKSKKKPSKVAKKSQKSQKTKPSILARSKKKAKTKSTKVKKKSKPTKVAKKEKAAPKSQKEKVEESKEKVAKDHHKMELKSSAKAVVVNASLQCQFRSKESQQYLPYPDCNGAALKEGDRFRVILSSPDDSYVYLFLSNDNGDRVMLFPDPGIVNKLRGSVEYVIPGEDWYELDENGGVKEQIRLIASRTPIAALEEARGLELNTKALQTIKKMSFRGVRKTRKPARASVRLQQLDTIVNSTGNDLSASISFEIDHK